MIKTIFANPFLRIPTLLLLSAGTVVTVAGGYYAVYWIVTFFGN
jgi:hypothetical protein